MVCLQDGRVFLRHPCAYEDELVYMYCESRIAAEVHQAADLIVGRWKLQCADV